MYNTAGGDCPLCPREMDGYGELRIHLMVDHRKSAVVEEYVERVEHSTAPKP